MDPKFSTSMTLLELLQRPDASPEHWENFHRLYAPLLLAWAKHKGVQDSDSFDIVQDVLMIVTRELPGYVRRPGDSFRSWLYTITRNKTIDVLRRRNRSVELDFHAQNLADPRRPDWLAEETEHRTALVHRACEIIQPSFHPRTWEAFVRVMRNHEPRAQVAESLQMKPGALHSACSRVMIRLRVVVDGFLEE